MFLFLGMRFYALACFEFNLKCKWMLTKMHIFRKLVGMHHESDRFYFNWSGKLNRLFFFCKTQLCQLTDFTIDSHSHLYLLQQNKNFQNNFLSRKNRAENRLYDQKLSRHLFLREKCRIKLQNWPIFVNSTRKKN